MEQYEPFLSLGLAAAAGLLIGLEREQSALGEGKQAEQFLGGARTHPFFALVGALSMLLGRQVGPAVPVAAFLAVAAFLLVNYADQVRRGGERGLTSEAAAMVSFLLGALALSRGILEPPTQRIFVVSATAVGAALLLSSKRQLRPFVRALSPEDVSATIKFLIVAVVVLPLLPDRALGPYEVWNPRQIGWFMVLIAGVSFVGYAAIRLLGPERGLGLTGVVGGFVSSTAVTLAMSSRAREEPRLATPCALAVLLASTIMFVRVGVVVAVINPKLAATLAIPLGAMAVAGLAACAATYLRSREVVRATQAVSFSNPFELSTAIKFALLFAAVLLVSKVAHVHLGSLGTYATSLVAGTTDVDAVSLSMGRLGGTEIALDVAATATVLALASNTIVKTAFAVGLGGGRFGRTVAAGSGAMLVAGAVGVAIARRVAG